MVCNINYAICAEQPLQIFILYHFAQNVTRFTIFLSFQLHIVPKPSMFRICSNTMSTFKSYYSVSVRWVPYIKILFSRQGKGKKGKKQLLNSRTSLLSWENPCFSSTVFYHNFTFHLSDIKVQFHLPWIKQ